MGLFDKVFKSQRDIAKEEIVEIDWVPLNNLEQLEEIIEESKERTIGIFKHSTRCGVSRMVLKAFEKDASFQKGLPVKLYFLDLISFRNISNAVAEKWGIRHESPQLLVIKDGQVVHHASHSDVSFASLEEHA